jgi:hypothetical protein
MNAEAAPTNPIHLSNSQRSAARRLCFRAAGMPASLFPSPSFEGMERREAPGSLRGSLHRLARPVFRAKIPGPKVFRGDGGPGARGPFCAKALRLRKSGSPDLRLLKGDRSRVNPRSGALHRVRVVGAPAPLRLRTPRSTAPSIEWGEMYIYSYRNEVKPALATTATRGLAP